LFNDVELVANVKRQFGGALGLKREYAYAKGDSRQGMPRHGFGALD